MKGLVFHDRLPMRIAASVENVASLKNPYARHIIDRRCMIDKDLINDVLHQSVFSWEGRNPSPALDADGNFQGTDLDLLSFLVGLAGRGAVIEIPHYTNRRKVVRRADERKIGTNQFGVVTSLASHREALSFSVNVFDQTIARTDATTGQETLGAPRKYMIVDCDGHWYNGWDRIVWKPDAKENEFLTRCGLWIGNTVYFTHYVHPNRVNALFGAPYLLLKMLLTRLDDEAGFYRQEMKRLQAMGITRQHNSSPPPTSEGPTENIRVETIEVHLDTPPFTGSYMPVSDTPFGCQQAYERQKLLTYTLKPRVQFVVRADEAAYFLHGAKQHYVAPWIQGHLWESGYKMPGGRIIWDRMVLSSDTALRFRLKEITQEVSAL